MGQRSKKFSLGLLADRRAARRVAPAENRKQKTVFNMRLGLDTGGTWKDLVCLGAGEGRVPKVPATPTEPLSALPGR